LDGLFSQLYRVHREAIHQLLLRSGAVCPTPNTQA
jgi:hypothetical protein